VDRVAVPPEALNELKEALIRHERTQAWLARKTQTSKSAVSNYLSGYRMPPATWLKQAREALGLVESPAPARRGSHAREQRVRAPPPSAHA